MAGVVSDQNLIGGDMGMFDGVLGGLVGGGMAAAVSHLIDEQGGVSAIVTKLEQGGLAETVKSWVGTGTNNPVSADQLHQALGPDLMQQLSAKTGISSDVLAQKLSELLPQVVDKLTPGGVITKA
ncbi:MAG TPA: YidB family protein [Vicinamibacterales bacterium]